MIETTIAIAVVMGLSQVIKKATDFPDKLAGLVALALALFIGFLTVSSGFTWQEIVFSSILVGLSASGAYSNTKNVSQYIESKSFAKK